MIILHVQSGTTIPKKRNDIMIRFISDTQNRQAVIRDSSTFTILIPLGEYLFIMGNTQLAVSVYIKSYKMYRDTTDIYPLVQCNNDAGNTIFCHIPS